MSQGDILRVLEKYKKPMSRVQIATVLKDDPIKVSHSIKRLLKGGDIKYHELDYLEARYYIGSMKLKRRTAVYYIRELSDKDILRIFNDTLNDFGINIRKLG